MVKLGITNIFSKQDKTHIYFFMKKGKKQEKLTPLTSIAFLFIIFAIVFNSRSISYALIGIGVLLAVVDIIIKSKKK